jgi:hypothetical protein
MGTLRYYHIQLTKNSEWQIEIASSLNEVMQLLTGSFENRPYNYFTQPF